MLLAEASSRLQARAALLQGQCSLAAHAACTCKEGGRIWGKLAKILQEAGDA